MGHLDVVPVNEKMWDFPPFDAEINNEFIYARGTIDAKQIVMVNYCMINISGGSKHWQIQGEFMDIIEDIALLEPQDGT